MMSSEIETNLKILNFLLSDSNIATTSGLPIEGEYRGGNFNFIWSKTPRTILVLIVKSELIHSKDIDGIKDSGFKFERPFCFLEYTIQNQATLSEIESEYTLLKESANKLRLSIHEHSKTNLDELKTKLINEKLGLYECYKQKPKSAAAHELKRRIEFLQTLMAREFALSCDKWNIPNKIVYPNCFLAEEYQQLLAYDPKGKEKLFEEWYKGFCESNKYP